MTVKFLGDSSTFEDTGPRDVSLVGQYTVLNTAGTTTLKATPGVFLGFECISVGTSFTAVAYDIVGTSTNQLTVVTTSTAGQWVSGAGPDLGIRTQGTLVAVTGGTAGQYNAIWD